MNVHFSYKISKTADLEKQTQHQLEKLKKHLQVFRPELVHVKGIVEENSAREGFVVSLNLRLPSGQMAAQEKSATAAAAIRAAFDALIEQLKRHKQVLRSKHKWVRRRDADHRGAETVRFEDTVAAVRPETVSSLDIASYIDVNLPRLERFVERQIAYRESLGELLPDQVAPEDVVAEAIATALERRAGKARAHQDRALALPLVQRGHRPHVGQRQRRYRRPARAPPRHSECPGQRRVTAAVSSARRKAAGRGHHCRRPCRQSRGDDRPSRVDRRGATRAARCSAIRPRGLHSLCNRGFQPGRDCQRLPTTRWRRCTRPSARLASTCNAPCPSRTCSKASTWSIPIAPEGAACRRPLRTLKQELTQENRNDHER